jgi:Cof subfamily protein (haloacid dehalogenase superfamily)
VVDVDGTLINSQGDISSQDRSALARVRQSGLGVSLSTGRGLPASLEIIDQLELDGFHISFDGALVSHPRLGEEVYQRTIDPATVEHMVTAAHEQNLELELFSVTSYFAERESWSTEAHRRVFGIEVNIMAFAGIWARERIIKGGLISTSSGQRARVQRFCHHFDSSLYFSWAKTPVCPEIDFINILASGVSKGNALQALASHLGISLGEVVAIGDGSNDRSLLAAAGLAIAMGNASDEIKAVADHVTLDVDHSGVAAAIGRFLS